MIADAPRAIGNPNADNRHQSTLNDDDATVKTAGSGSKEPEMRELSIKWCLNSITDAVKAKAVHATVPTTMLEVFPDELVVIDHNREEIKYGTAKPWINASVP